MVNITEEQLLTAIKDSAGIVHTIAKRLNVSWTTAKKYIDGNENTKLAYYDEKQKIIDLAESTVINAINSQDVQTAKWYLGLIGRDRGYAEKIELEHNINTPVRIVIEGVTPESPDSE